MACSTWEKQIDLFHKGCENTTEVLKKSKSQIYGIYNCAKDGKCKKQ